MTRTTKYWLIAAALLLNLGLLTVSANITLARFEATPQADGSILVVWETATEFDTAGFNLYRALEPLALNADWGAPIATQQAEGDGFTGATYQYRDTDVVPGVRYYYLLEELTAAGPGQRAGPVNAGIGLEPEATATATATVPATVTPTATASRTATATTQPPPGGTQPPATASRTATATAQPPPGGTQPPATATRQFTNTPVPLPTATPGPGATWTPAPSPTATPVPVGQVVTPTPTEGAPILPTAPELPTPTAAPLPTATQPPIMQEPTPAAVTAPAEPTSTAETTGPTAASTPQVFAQTAGTQALLDVATRPAPTPAQQAQGSTRNTRLLLLLGGGAMALAGVLAIAGLLIWRASRPR